MVVAEHPSSSVPRHPSLSWLSTRLERCSDRVGARAVPPAGQPSLDASLEGAEDTPLLGGLVKAWQWPAQHVPSLLVTTPGKSLRDREEEMVGSKNTGSMGGLGWDEIYVQL